MNQNNITLDFETSNGRRFTMEISLFDTVLKIKEKIQESEGYPVSSQKLVFNGQVLADDRDSKRYKILQGSRIQLLVTDDEKEAAGGGPANVENDACRFRITVTFLIANTMLSLKVHGTDTVLRLKERIRESEGIPVDRFALYHRDMELLDCRTLAESGVAAGSKVHLVTVRPSPPGLAASESMMLKLFVRRRGRMIPVVMNASDNVSELREEFRRFAPLLAERYTLVHGRNVMKDDRSLIWHGAWHGDTINLFE